MSLNDLRGQLLANLKCIYGSNVEVLTLYVPHKMYQAVATSFDPSTATWTKFLHSELVYTSRDAIDALLKDSEKELTKLLSASGNTVPFQGVMEQSFTLRRGGQRRDSISADSMRSDPIFITTPASTLSDTGSRNFVEAEHPVEVPAPGEPLVDKAPVNETVIEDINKHTHPPPEEEPAEDHWGSWDVAKIKKNGGKKADPEAPKVELIVEEPAPLEDDWSFGKKKEKKKKSKSDVVVDVAEEQIEEPAVDVVPDDDFGWGNYSKKKDKKKKGKSDVVEEQIEEPMVEEPAVDDFGWASFGKKDTKKKSGKAAVEGPPKVKEPVEAPDPEPEEEYIGWANAWGKKGKKKGKNMPIEVIDETPAPDPVPVPANDAKDDWGIWGTSKKDKKGKGKKSIIEALAPTPTLPTRPEIESVSDPVEDPKLDELPASSPLPSPSPSASESAQLTHTLRTVVFTIELPNELSDKSLQVMATIADDTRTAIIESVNSYLDLQSIPKGIQVQRKVKIKYGVGRNGHIDVSTLEETMWPQYLDYFCQYTRIPELTVEIMEC